MLEKSKAEILHEQLSARVQAMNPGERLMSIRQLMQEFGVSQLTVDQALSRLETDGRVIREPGKGIYVRDNSISDLLRVGFVVPDWPSQCIKELDEVLKNAASKFNSRVSRYCYPIGCDICYNLPVKDFDVIILMPEFNQFTPEFLNRISSAPIPVVLCGVSLRDVLINCVAADPVIAGCQAASYLIGKGHRRLAVAISEPRNSSIIEDRLEGFSMLARLSGCELTVIDCEINHGEYAQDKTYQKMTAWLSNHPLDFSALYLMSDETALAAMRALTEHGIAIPDQVSVLGPDGLRQGAFYHPPLTTVGSDYHDVAESLLEIAQASVTDRSRVWRRTVKLRIIERSSVKAL